MKRLLKLLFTLTLVTVLTGCSSPDKLEKTPGKGNEQINNEIEEFESIKPKLGEFEEITQPSDDAATFVIEWEPIEGVDGYEIEYSIFDGQKNVDKTDAYQTLYKISFQDMNTLRARVRGYKIIAEQEEYTLYTQWSDETSVSYEELYGH